MIDNKLNMIKVAAQNIISNMNCVLNDIENFEGYDELSTIETAMRRTEREADSTIDIIMNAYDEIEEE